MQRLISKCVSLCTSAADWGDMKCWLISDNGDQWSVTLDARDLGGHLGSTQCGRAPTLTARVRLVVAGVVLVAAIRVSC